MQKIRVERALNTAERPHTSHVSTDVHSTNASLSYDAGQRLIFSSFILFYPLNC
jgi:hypothetical protein